tara:strand:- start:438 stop:824 length:387 start_codon:yes stop_codon:yes gene_type:complete
VAGLLQGAFAGVVWSAVAWNWGVSDLSTATATATSSTAAATGRRASFSVAIDAARSAAMFGAVLGGFVGAKCAAAQMRQKEDWINSWAGGLTVGAVLGTAHSPTVRQGAVLAVACSAFAGASHALWAP